MTAHAAEIGTYQNTLIADAADVVTFDADVPGVEVYSNGAAALYFTVDGTDPEVEGEGTYEIPAYPGTREVEVPTSGHTVVKLISAGTPKYSVTRVGIVR